MSKGVRYECPSCGSNSVYIDSVSAYWDEDSQSWELSDGFDDDHPDLNCGECGDEFSLLEAEVSIEPKS